MTSFLLDRLADVRFEVIYVRGVNNIADGLSRYPMLGPRQWQWAGLEALFRLLAASVDGLLARAATVWVYAGNDTERLQRLVREAAPHARLTHTALAAGFGATTDFAVLAPAPDRAPAACARMLRRGMPGACLVPADLVVQVPAVLNGTVDEEVAVALRTASFIGSASAGFLWVVTGRSKADMVVAPVVAGTSRLEPEGAVATTAATAEAVTTTTTEAAVATVTTVTAARATVEESAAAAAGAAATAETAAAGPSATVLGAPAWARRWSRGRPSTCAAGGGVS